MKNLIPPLQMRCSLSSQKISSNNNKRLGWSMPVAPKTKTHWRINLKLNDFLLMHQCNNICILALVLMAIVRSCILWIKSWCNKNAARGKRTTSIKEPELFACWWVYRKELAVELPVNVFIWKLVGLHRLAWRSLNQPSGQFVTQALWSW